MIKYRVEITALPETRDEAMCLMENLKPHNETLGTSSVVMGGKELWRVDFGTEFRDDDRTIEQVQEFIDKLKDANEAVASLETEQRH